MSTVLKGRAVYIELPNGVVLGTTSNTLTISPEFESFFTKDQPDEQYAFKSAPGTIDLNALVVVKESSEEGVTVEDVLDMAVTGQSVKVSVIGLGGTASKKRTCQARVTSFSEDTPADGNATFSATLSFPSLTVES